MSNVHPLVASAAEVFKASQPEFVTLPTTGGDKVTGLSRSFWYRVEKDGLIQLTRVRLPGRQRGRVLLPVAQALEVLRKLGAESAAGAQATGT